MSGPKSTPYRLLAVDDEAAILDGYTSVLAPTIYGLDAPLSAMEAELFGDAVDPDARFPKVVLETQANGAAAVEAVRNAMLEANPFTIVYIDVRMPPGINGVDAATEIRSLDANVEIVFVSRYSDFEAEVKALKIRPIDKLYYVDKPFEGDHLWDLTIALCQKWSRQELAGPTELGVLQRASFSARPLLQMPLSDLKEALDGSAA